MGRKVFAGIVAAIFFYMTYPFLFPIAMGAVLAVLFVPWLEWLEKKKISSSIGSGLLTLGITVVLILPTSLLIFFAAKNGFQQIQEWKNIQIPEGSSGLVESFINSPRVHGVLVWVSSWAPMNTESLIDTFHELSRSVGLKLADFLGGVFTHLPGMVLNLTVIVVSVYFFLVDGRRLMIFIRRNSMFSAQQTEQLIGTLAEMCRSVILAAIVSGGIQATLEAIACVFTGTPNAHLIALFVFVSSFLPLVGASPVTVTVGLQQILEGRQAAGTVLLVMVLINIGIDNLVRPLFLRGTANLHPFMAFIAAIGGLQTLGFLGVFLGPILAALFVVSIQILGSPNETEHPSEK